MEPGYKDKRFLHPQEGSIHPIVSEVYYWLGVTLHHIRTYEEGLVAGDETTVYVKTQALKLQANTWRDLLKFAHEAAYEETPTTNVDLVREIPYWASGDTNASWATKNGVYVLYQDYAETDGCTTGACAPWAQVWNVTRWSDRDRDGDHHVATVTTLDAARAVIAADSAPQADAHVRTWRG